MVKRALACVAVIAIAASVIVAVLVTIDRSRDMSRIPALPFCQSEDSEDCYWDARRMGNGDGRSFYRWEGVTYYVD